MNHVERGVVVPPHRGSTAAGTKARGEEGKVERIVLRAFLRRVRQQADVTGNRAPDNMPRLSDFA